MWQPYAQKLALTSPTSGGRSVGIVRSQTQATEFSFTCVCLQFMNNNLTMMLFCLDIDSVINYQIDKHVMLVHEGSMARVRSKKDFLIISLELSNCILSKRFYHVAVLLTLPCDYTEYCSLHQPVT
jgi:hypothetical protein